MIIIKGKYNVAKVMIDEIDGVTKEQIQSFVNQPMFGDKKKIRIMPDCHAGKGSCIGFTMELGEYIMPQIVGVDIGCGMRAVNLGVVDINLPNLDTFITNNIPHGHQINSKVPTTLSPIFSERVSSICGSIKIDSSRVFKSIGSLGGGNHFIELAKDSNGYTWLIIHSGSRNFGKMIAEHYQKQAKKELEKRFVTVDKDMEFLYYTDKNATEYLFAMAVAQEYASLNRTVMANKIIEEFNLSPISVVESVHNYIDFDALIIRKGAISAQKGEGCIIPFNSAEGSALCRGKGNPDWNFSAPHGAGRLYSRTKARELFDYKEYQKRLSDNGVYSTTANTGTLDECPMAYKSKDTILKYIEDTVEIVDMLKPIYNFKANEGGRR